MTIERFEDIRAWQEARVLANLVYDATEAGTFARDFGLRDQIREAAGSIMHNILRLPSVSPSVREIREAAGSIMHNIAEGFEAGSDAEFIKFLKYSRRSASEVQSELYLTLDRKHLTPDSFQPIYDKATEVKKLINAFIGYLRRSTS